MAMATIRITMVNHTVNFRRIFRKIQIQIHNIIDTKIMVETMEISIELQRSEQQKWSKRL